MSDTSMIVIVVIVILLILLFTTSIVIPLRKVRKNKEKADVLRATGIYGEATILQIEDTGVKVNNNPRMSVLLEVRLPDHAPYEVRKVITVPSIRQSRFFIGVVLPVLADPSERNNPDKVGIVLK